MPRKLTPREKSLARRSLREERTAIREYTARRAESRNGALQSAYSHAIPEEKDHARLFKRALGQG